MPSSPQVPLWFRFLASFAVAWLADVVAAVHIQTLMGGQMALAAGTIFTLQVINGCGLSLFVDDRSTLARVAVTLATAGGAALGTITVLACSH